VFQGWFTTVAQIVNFLVLLVLLWFLLYKRILRAMDERQQDVASRFEQAEKKQQAAQAKDDAYQGKLRELDEHRETKLEEAAEEAARFRKERIAQAKEETDAVRQEWYEALQSQKQQFLQQVREEAAHRVCNMTRKALSDLADADLEERIVNSFMNQLRALAQADKQVLKDALQDSGQLVLRSTFDLTEDRRQDVRAAIGETLGTGDNLAFTTGPDLICGIELRGAGRAVGWNVSDYLDEIERELTERLEAEIRAGEPGETKTGAEDGDSGKSTEDPKEQE